MINADAMLKSVNRLERVFGGETRATQSIGEVAEILTRLLQAEKDAARYRWLRDDYRHEYCVDDLFDGSSSSVDKRIDEAMQCSK